MPHTAAPTKLNQTRLSPKVEKVKDRSVEDAGPWAWQWHQSGQELTQLVDGRKWTSAKDFFDTLEEYAPYLYETITDAQWSNSSECPWRVDPRLMNTLRACLQNFADDGMKMPPDAQEGYRRTIAGALGAWKDLPQYKDCWESRPWPTSVDLPQMVRELCEIASSDESSDEDTELESCSSSVGFVQEIDEKPIEEEVFVRQLLDPIPEE